MAEEDAQKLHKAFKGLGTDEAAIIDILAHRNGHERDMIKKYYEAHYEVDLLKDLKDELSGDFLRAVLLRIPRASERDAKSANEAMKKSGGGNVVLLEIACTRPDAAFQVKGEYHALYKKCLEEDVAYHTTGDFRKLLVPLVSVYRYRGPEVDMELAQSEAKILHDKISEKAYADDEIIRILSTRSIAQLSATLNQYNDQFGSAINKDLKADPKDEYLRLLRATIKCLTCPKKYYAKALNMAVKGLGTDEDALTRLIVTQAEPCDHPENDKANLERIKEEYHKRYNVTLEEAIVGDTSGDYKRFLLALLGHHDA